MKSIKEFDVIIIGAGPAGLACACELSNSKLSVLILDKRNILGGKPCGGGICEKEVSVPIESSWSKRINKQIISSEKSIIKVKHRFERITFEREDLAGYQERLLSEAKNITLMKNVLVSKIRLDSIETNQGSFKYKYLVGADGVTSVVRAYLKLPVKLAMGMYYKIWGEYDEFVAYYNLENLGPGYIWEFPHPKYNNIGIYFEQKFLNSKKAKEILEDYLRKRKYTYSEKDFLAAPVNYNYMGHQFNNIYLIGDAGGFTSRMHGGGINNAIISGTEVAKLIKDSSYKAKPLFNLIKSKHRDDRLIDYYSVVPMWLAKIFFTIFVNLYRIPFFQKILPV
jgi:geranylgeranyl reductase